MFSGGKTRGVPLFMFAIFTGFLNFELLMLRLAVASKRASKGIGCGQSQISFRYVQPRKSRTPSTDLPIFLFCAIKNELYPRRKSFRFGKNPRLSEFDNIMALSILGVELLCWSLLCSLSLASLLLNKFLIAEKCYRYYYLSPPISIATPSLFRCSNESDCP